MTTNTQPQDGKTQAPATGMRGEIQQKWGKFSAQEITALKNKDDLVAQVQAKYSLDKTSGATRRSMRSQGDGSSSSCVAVVDAALGTVEGGGPIAPRPNGNGRKAPAVTERITHTTVTFRHPFELPGMEGEQAAADICRGNDRGADRRPVVASLSPRVDHDHPGIARVRPGVAAGRDYRAARPGRGAKERRSKRGATAARGPFSRAITWFCAHLRTGPVPRRS